MFYSKPITPVGTLISQLDFLACARRDFQYVRIVDYTEIYGYIKGNYQVHGIKAFPPLVTRYEHCR